MLALVIESLIALASRGEVPRDIAARKLLRETTLDELAIDSLGKLALLSELEDRSEVNIAEGTLDGVRSLGDLADLLASLKKVAA
jgi:acyl carrier protein